MERFQSQKKFIRETIDKYNRVTKLEFFREENVLGNHVLPASIINYEYERDKIIETLLDKFNQKTYADEHGCSYKTIYHLDENKFIIKVERFTDYESISPKWEDLADLGYKPPTIEELKEEIKYTDSINNRNTGRQIEFYKYSFAKMDGVYPVSKDFDIEKEIDLKAFIPTMEKGIHKGVEKLFKNLKE
ncbi:hypothetical protein SAMN05192588_0670 [Nonlabens sp. Hel1_33_55]|uniref:hypothetical protein n=1 Tax=Nonlabens sp. Hel1_33_55 TaxID=1336802 RepID=UPI000875AC08|nr:hypothetical protein [Nonlabens sp. Hel1_33_55]SCY00186.1 hypothetical protein SAMN05192588_0670 [Nonlabens sp. Hel1_33_55]